MAPLVAGLLDKGAAIFLTTCNPTTVQNDVVARLERRGAQAYARRDMSAGEWSESSTARWPGSRLTCAKWGGFDHPLAPIAERPADRRRAGSHRIGHQPFERRGAALPDLQLGRSAGERGLHNRHMVGLTARHTFFQTTHLTLHEKRVLVIGYGPVGQGTAAAAVAYGGRDGGGNRSGACAAGAL